MLSLRLTCSSAASRHRVTATVCASKPPLASRPELVQQWHPTKNGKLTPFDVTLGSTQIAWWQCTACPCGCAHDWQTAVSTRTAKGSGCPICAGKRPCACRALATSDPNIAKQWDVAGNSGLQPTEISSGSHSLVHWVCHEHEQPFKWTARVYQRTRQQNPSGCPECGRASGRKPRQRKHPHACICYSPTVACLSRAAVSWIILAGQPKLLEACPKVAAQWHPSRNGDQALGTVTCGSGLKAWWLCKDAQCGHQHSWQATISDRVKRQSGCPVCAGSKPCICNSLAALHSDVIQKQWDFERNTVSPEELLPQSGAKVHWRCDLHEPPHTWTATPNDRFSSRQRGCMKCGHDRQRKPAAPDTTE